MSQESDRELIVGYDPSLSTKTYRPNESGILYNLTKLFKKKEAPQFELRELDMTPYRDFTNDEVY